MEEKNMFSYIVFDKLEQLMKCSLHTTQLKKLRDLFIGMILNLTCNIEDDAMILEIV